MQKNKVGLVFFWIGAVYLLVGGWLVNWRIVPIYKHTLPEQINETIWAPGGPLFIVWCFAIPVGAILAAMGRSLYDEPKKFWLPLIAGAFIILSAMFPQTMRYYIAVFGILGGLISLLFIAIVWFWAKKRKALEGPNKVAHDFQLIGAMFFLAAAWLTCGVLGNPFHTNPGLYFPEKVLEAGSLPLMYSQGIKVGLYLVLGFLFIFLSHYKAAQAEK